MSCNRNGCGSPVILRAYAAYNADNGENAHPRHARYPVAMIQACANHAGDLLLNESKTPGSTRQYLVVVPNRDAA
jgi:hypothetical protein